MANQLSLSQKSNKNMTFDITFTAKARSDLRQIHAYISKNLQNPTSATKIIIKILDKISILKLFPYRGNIFLQAKPEFGEIRTIKTKTYLILYSITNQPPTIIIHRIIYARRDLSAVL